MSPIEILAFIFAVFVLAKIVIVAVRPKMWMNLTKPFLKNPGITMIIYVVLAAIVGFYLFQAVSIITVAASALFVSLLFGIGVIPFSKSVLKLSDDVLKTGINKAWLPILVWVLLSVWVLYILFLQ